MSDAGLRDEDEALYLLRRDIEAIERELDRLWPLWRHLDDVRSDVVVSMAFNLGVAGFMAFKKLGNIWSKAGTRPHRKRCCARSGPVKSVAAQKNFRR
ncbi:MAG: hypothetical protein CL569_16925 [Alphaproteobacteria bacterium]|nr:hypothetical protein [Alphaproteobacteria bacterium]